MIICHFYFFLKYADIFRPRAQVAFLLSEKFIKKTNNSSIQLRCAILYVLSHIYSVSLEIKKKLLVHFYLKLAMFIIMRQGYIYLYKLNFTVESRIGSEWFRDDIIRCFHFTGEETEAQRSKVFYSTSKIICDTLAGFLIFSFVTVLDMPIH